MNILKKNKKNESKNHLPMPEKVKRGFRYYCSLVMALALMGCCTMTVFAATNDPLAVLHDLLESPTVLLGQRRSSSSG